MCRIFFVLTKQGTVCEFYQVGEIRFVLRNCVNERNGSSPQQVGGTIMERVVWPCKGQKRPNKNNNNSLHKNQ
jgi:hypothetical protein